MQALRSKLTYANVISTLCLFMLLGGGAYAASRLPVKSVGTRQLKNGAVTGRKIRKASIEAIKLTPLAMMTLKGARGPKGATGAKGAAGARGERGPSGPQGAPGNSGAFATVLVNSAVQFQGTHPGFTAVERKSTGIYCLTPSAGTDISHPIASTNWAGSESEGLFVEPLAGGAVSACLAGRLEVRTDKLQTGTLADTVSFTVFAPAG
jgi:hypothetical protein